MSQLNNPSGPPGLWPVQWPAHPRVRACMTVRSGGVSAAPWDSFNLAEHVGDDPRAVSANRALLAECLGVAPLFMAQVHGVTVLDLAQGLTGPADACLSASPDQVCTVMVADCLPVLLADRQGRWVGAAHAGWRGLAGALPDLAPAEANAGVLEALVQALGQRGVQPQDLMAWLGPCIGPEQFEVGDEVRAAFCTTVPDAALHFRPADREGHWWADLPALARQRLQALGVTAIFGNDGGASWCTVSQPSLFFSHRRDSRVNGSTGRMAAMVWLAEDC